MNISDLKIVDQLGKVIYSNANTSSKIIINTEKFSNGFYFVTFNDNIDSKIIKIEILK